MSKRRSLAFIKPGAAVVVTGSARDTCEGPKSEFNLAFVTAVPARKSKYSNISVRVGTKPYSIPAYALYPICPEVIAYATAHDAYIVAFQQRQADLQAVSKPIEERWQSTMVDLSTKQSAAARAMKDKIGGW